MIDTCKQIWGLSRQRHSGLIKALVLSSMRALLGVTQLAAILVTMDVLTGERAPKTGIVVVGLMALLCVLGNFLTSYGEQTCNLEASFFTVADQRTAIAKLLRKFPLGFFNETSAGRISATLTTTLTGVETAAAMVLVGIVSGFFNAAALLLFMLFYDWRVGIITGVGMVCYLLLVRAQIRLSRRYAPAMQEAQTRLAQAAVTFLQGIKVTKAFSFQSCDRKLKQAIQGSCSGNIDLTDRSMPTQIAAGLCIAGFESLILLAALYLGIQGGERELAKTVLLVVFSFLAYASLNQAGSMLSMIGILDAGLAELTDIEAGEQLQQVQPEEQALSNEIVFHDVSFSYGAREVLHHVSAVIRPNTLTALIGPSGSGKTTLCQLIPRFRDVTSGSITIGGADVRHMGDQALMAKISMVFQHVYLFEDTILNNIRFGKPEATLEQVQAAARAACCHEFITALPQGYDTVLEEGGGSLSGGEKQRIAIARAILKDAPIIILDEATSALDAENEHEILNAIDALTRDKTVIMIAHRLKSVERADHIIGLKDGSIVQEGTHAQLEKVPGLYADFLASRQEAARWTLHP